MYIDIKIKRHKWNCITRTMIKLLMKLHKHCKKGIGIYFEIIIGNDLK